MIIEENRIDNKKLTLALINKDNSINILVNTNANLYNRNNILIENYAVMPENDDNAEYLTIIRKYRDNFDYDDRVKERSETLHEYRDLTYKHYKPY